MAEGQEPNIAWVSPADPAPDACESLASALSCTVEVVPPSLPEESFAVLAEAAAVVIDWELGDRWALDVVESLRCDGRTREVPLVVASPGLTRIQVSSLLAAGADTVVQQPWDEDELRARVNLRSAPDPEAAAPDAPQHEQENPE